MKKILFLLSFLLSGCVTDRNDPHSTPYYYPASVYVFNNKLCVHISERDFQGKENILSISIHEYGSDGTDKNSLFNRHYSDLNGNVYPVLVPSTCIDGFSSFPYETGKGYFVRIDTPLNTYMSKFIVWKRFDGLAVSLM